MTKKIFISVATVILVLFMGVSGATEKIVPIKLACVGDSITFGFGIKDREAQSYPAQLGALLGNEWIVSNFGKNGATALKKGHAPYWKTPQFKEAKSFKPDVVIIKLGTNDSRPMNWDAHKKEYVADYVELIQTFQHLESKPRVLICYPVPAYPGIKGVSDTVIKNEVIPLINEIAKKAKVEIIDLYSALSGKKHLFPDTLHPDAEGAKLIADMIFTTITSEIPKEVKKDVQFEEK